MAPHDHRLVEYNRCRAPEGDKREHHRGRDDYSHGARGFDSRCVTIEAFVDGRVELEELANEWIG